MAGAMARNRGTSGLRSGRGALIFTAPYPIPARDALAAEAGDDPFAASGRSADAASLGVRRLLPETRGTKVRRHEGPNSLKSLRGRHRMNQLVRRKGRVYIINKVQKRYKARQG